MIVVTATNGYSRHKRLECAFARASKLWKDGASEVSIVSDPGASLQLQRTRDGVYGRFLRCLDPQHWHAYAAKYGLPCPPVAEFTASLAKLQSFQRLD